MFVWVCGGAHHDDQVSTDATLRTAFTCSFVCLSFTPNTPPRERERVRERERERESQDAISSLNPLSVAARPERVLANSQQSDVKAAPRVSQAAVRFSSAFSLPAVTHHAPAAAVYPWRHAR